MSRNQDNLVNSLATQGNNMREHGSAASHIEFTYSTPEFSIARRSFIRTVEKLGGQNRLKRLYHRYLDEGGARRDFFQSAVDLLRLKIHVDRTKLQSVPLDEPVLFIANHPYGVLDGIVLTWLARQARSDVKVLANHVLCQAPEARDNLLPIDFSETPEAMQVNLASRREAQRHIRNGGAIGIFPAGAVGASEKPLRGPAVDSIWQPFTGKLIMTSRATVVPIYFAGQNSRLFQLASHLSYTLRLSLFFWETARRIGSDLDVVIGDPIPFDAFEGVKDRTAIVRSLRQRTFALASNLTPPPVGLPPFDREFTFPRHFKF
jgi:putative hemolysin